MQLTVAHLRQRKGGRRRAVGVLLLGIVCLMAVMVGPSVAGAAPYSAEKASFFDDLSNGVSGFIQGDTGQVVEATRAFGENATITRGFDYERDAAGRMNTKLVTRIAFDGDYGVEVVDTVPKEFAAHASECAVATSPEATVAVAEEDPVFSFRFENTEGGISINYTVQGERGTAEMERIIAGVASPAVYALVSETPRYRPVGKVTITEAIATRRNIELTPEQVGLLRQDLVAIIAELVLFAIVLLWIAYNRSLLEPKPIAGHAPGWAAKRRAGGPHAKKRH